MTMLFSPFDLYYFSSWFLFFIVSSFVFINFFFTLSVSKDTSYLGISMLLSFFSSLKPKMSSKFSGLVFIVMFVVTFIINFLSVFPYNFPISSQPSMIWGVSLGVWVGLIFFSLIKNMKGTVSHFIPEGAPLSLIIFLFLIELVSTVIRPLTLMVRLVANILAGHLLMSLLSSLVFIFPFCSLLYVILNLIEMIVALIQAYIFTTMIVLYCSEV